MRTADIKRNTAETEIALSLNLDGTGLSEIDSGCGFLDHMLTLFAKHGRFDLKLVCRGDTYVDYHHSVEDIGICLGKAFAEALGEKKGIRRYGFFILPMDEALLLSAVDFSGRCYLHFDAKMPEARVGDFDTELVEEFWWGFVRNADCTLHIKEFEGRNVHHIIEGMFKCIARSMREAVSIDEAIKDEIPSTKGVL